MKYFYPEQERYDMKTLARATAALALGFTLGILATAYAQQPKATIKTYDCDTLQDIPSELYFNPTAAHQIQKLHDQCQQQRNAIMLQQQWEKDPTGGVVLEHHKN